MVNCKTKPELNLIQNPAAKPVPREVVSVVRYVVAQEAWRQAAEAGDRATRGWEPVRALNLGEVKNC